MKSILIEGHEAHDINKQIRRVIKGLGNPEPPLNLDEVLELLNLDRAYYSGTDDSVVREVVSRITVAGKQVIRRPTILFDVIKKAKLSALWLPDKKRILIDESKPKLKHRWSESHEIGHSIIPWHQEYLLGDNESSLNPACHAQIEAEANYATGKLLFLQEQFMEEASDLKLGFNSVLELKKRYGNTISSTLWRYVEEAHRDLAVVGIVSGHPHKPIDEFDPQNPCRHCVQSPKFRDQFSGISEKQLFRIIGGYCGLRSRGPIGTDAVHLIDDNHERHLFHFESFSNTYDVLTLGYYLHPFNLTK